jgi:hypothetical protein
MHFDEWIVMKLSTERKVYVAVLSLGLVALAIDRVSFSPQGAKAADAPGGAPKVGASASAAAPAGAATSPTASPPGAAPPRAGGAETRPSGPSLSARLHAAAERSGVLDRVTADAFAGERSENAQIAAQAPAQAPDRTPPASELFAATHSVKSLVVGPHGMAVVNGTPIAIGDRVGKTAFVLVAVDQAGAHFEADGVRVTLKPAERLLRNDGGR